MAPPNDSSNIRDHLANERTYLAWMRTGIATMGFGVVIAKLRFLFPSGELTPPSAGFVHASDIGLVFTGIGLLTVLFSVRRYLVVQEQIRAQKYIASNEIVLVFSGIVVVLGLLIVWYLLRSASAV
jgi:putative membrane protein